MSKSTTNSKPATKPKQTRRSAKAKSLDAKAVSLPVETPHVEPSPAPDPFDPASLRLPQDFASTAGVKKKLVKVLCRKPHKSEFVRVRPGDKWRVDMATYEDKIDNIVYMVDRELISELAESVQYVRLRTAVNRQGDVFLWPCRLPSPDGRRNQWHDSAIEMAALAEKEWTRVVANMSAGMYEPYVPINRLEAPVWPEHSFRDLIAMAFRDNRIDSIDHPVLRSLRGEV